MDWIALPWPVALKWAALLAWPLALLGVAAIIGNVSLRRALRQAQAQQRADSNVVTQAKMALARAEERDHGWKRLYDRQREDHRQLIEDYQALQATHQHVQTLLATTRESAELNRQHLEEKITQLDEYRDQFFSEFSQLSERIFADKAVQNRQGLGEILLPFKEQLYRLQQKVEQLHIEDSKDRAGLQAQIHALHQLNRDMTAEAHALATALRGEHKTQGNWGEMVLERVLERSGLRRGEEYRREVVVNDGHRRLRPDVVINLPEQRHLIIDSKVSLNAYSDYVNADNDASRERALKAHIAALRQHIITLGGKAYQHLEGLHSPDFVLMFVPVEPAFMAAFAADEQLFDEAFSKKIAVVTPTTLLATLRTVAGIWALERRNQSTEQLADEAGKVYDKLALLLERVEKLGKQLATTQKTYDELWHGLTTGNGNLVSTVERFRDIGIRSRKTIAKEISAQAKGSDFER